MQTVVLDGVILLLGVMLSTVRTGEMMLEVVEIEDGVFKVTVTDMHYDCLDKTSKQVEICSEAVLAMWIGSGMVELAGFAES